MTKNTLPISSLTNLKGDALSEHLSNFLVEHYSHSASKTFGRNQKLFEKRYIYRERSDLIGVSAAVGSAYHEALEKFWFHFKATGERMTAEELSVIALKYLNDINPENWKSDAYTPEKQLSDAIKQVNVGLQSFIKEGEAYFSQIKEIVSIESFFVEFIVLNGVEVPIPLVGRIDLLIIDQNGDLVLIDHKTCRSFTIPAEINYKYSEQSVDYRALINSFIARTLAGIGHFRNEEQSELAEEFVELAKKYPKIKNGVKRFMYFENKVSKNRDGGRQIQMIPIDFDDDTLTLFEAYAYVNAKKMCEAVSNPDYVYSINTDDNWLSAQEKNELVEFWIRTQIAEVDSFERLKPAQRDLLKRRTRKIKDTKLTNVSPQAIEKFREMPSNFITLYSMNDMTNAEKIEHRLGFFSINAKVAKVVEGFSCDLYLVDISGDTAMNRLFKHRLDLAKALDVPTVRIPKNLIQTEIDGKNRSFLGIEVNRENQESVEWSKDYLVEGLKVPIGIDNFRNPIYWDLEDHSTPHLLGGGATGSGKSVFIASLLKAIETFPNTNITILDPKREFSEVKGANVIQEVEDMEAYLRDAVNEMEKRFKEGVTDETPREVIIFDELNVAISMSQSKKVLEKLHGVTAGRKRLNKMEDQKIKFDLSIPKGHENFYKEEIETMEAQIEAERKDLHRREQLARTLLENNLLLLQKARSAKFNLVEFGQRLTAKVLDGDAKMNFPVRVCFYVPSEVDSRVVLDETGAEELKGKGDGLFASPSYPLTRFQGFFTEL